MNKWIHLLLAAAALGPAGDLRSELQWTTRRLLLEPPAGTTETSGEFEFINQGSNPIRIVEVRTDCGCTVIAPAKELVLPGEKGTLRAIYHLESRGSRESVGIAVTTHEPEIRRYDLTLEVIVRESVVVTPRTLSWKLGESPGSRILYVTLPSGFRVIGAESTTPEFTVQVVAQTERALQLHVAPRDTWAKRTGTIKIRVAQGEQAPVEVTATVRVL